MNFDQYANISGNRSAYAPMSPAPQPPRHNVTQELNRVHDAVSNLEQFVQELNVRLSPVLFPTGPDSANPGQGVSSYPPISSELEGIEAQIGRVNSTLGSILERLDL